MSGPENVKLTWFFNQWGGEMDRASDWKINTWMFCKSIQFECDASHDTFSVRNSVRPTYRLEPFPPLKWNKCRSLVRLLKMSGYSSLLVFADTTAVRLRLNSCKKIRMRKTLYHLLSCTKSSKKRWKPVQFEERAISLWVSFSNSKNHTKILLFRGPLPQIISFSTDLIFHLHFF